jgi:hypothetical protein
VTRAALGTMNALLFALRPLSLLGTPRPARARDALLAAKFGAANADHARRAGCLWPRLAAG